MDRHEDGRVTQNVALSREDREALRQMAEWFDGGNVSRTTRRLIRKEWESLANRIQRIEAEREEALVS